MRCVVIAALLLAGCDTPEAAVDDAAAAPAHEAQPRSRFDFRGLVRGMSLEDARRTGLVTACYDLGFEKNCSLADRAVGGRAFLEHSVSFKDGRFDGFVLFARPDDFEPIR